MSLGTPLAVDPAYGDEGPLRRPDGSVWLERTPLHAESLRIAHPVGRAAAGAESAAPR